MKNQKLSLFLPAPKGLEEVLADEVAEITGRPIADVKIRRAGVAIMGDLKDAYALCLHSRVANRVLVELAQFDASSVSKLYGGVKGIRWSDHLNPELTIAVDFTKDARPPRQQDIELGEDFLRNTLFGAQKCKDAICDQMVEVCGARPSVDTANPDLKIHVHWEYGPTGKGRASVALDLSGDSLHRRGYRVRQQAAPLKENLAAALLRQAGWHKRNDCLVDLMCGSGTFLFEGFLMSAKIPPRWAGREPQSFGFERWLGHDAKVWEAVRGAATAAIVRDIKKMPLFYGYDQDPKAVLTARDNLAGIHPQWLAGQRIHFEVRALADTAAPGRESGVVVVNPPYGIRMESGVVEEDLKQEYRAIGDTFKKHFKGFEGYILAPHGPLTHSVGLKADRRFEVYNGAIECRWLKYSLYSGSKV